MGETFADFLGRWANHFGTISALAEQIGMNQSRLTRVMKGEGALNVLNCLSLARVTGESPSDVLRLAGKASEAELIEELYCNSQRPTSRRDLERLERWRALPAKAHVALDKVIEVVLEKEASRSERKGAAVRRRRKAAHGT